MVLTDLKKINIMQQDEEDLKKLAESIDDESYFEDAMNWYITKFCNPITERVFWFTVLVFFSFFIYNLQNQLRAWYPIKIHRPIIIYNKDTTMKQVVKKMQNPYNNADYAILRHLIKHYVTMREEFLKGSLDLLKIDNRLKRVANNSSKEISRDYQKLFDLDDVRNPIRRLGKSGTRKIDIIDIELKIRELSMFEKAKRFNQIIELPRMATVTYRVREETARNKSNSIWKVIVGFNYSGVIIDTSNKDLTFGGFTVTGYKQRKIKQ